MTKSELLKDLRKIDSCIEIYQTLITKPLCNCISQVQDSYRESNKKELAYLLNIKNLLIPLTDKSDEALGYIDYEAVHKKLYPFLAP